MSDIFDADEKQELIWSARKMAEHAGIINDALRARLPHSVADQLTEDWWRFMVASANAPDFTEIARALFNQDDDE